MLVRRKNMEMLISFGQKTARTEQFPDEQMHDKNIHLRKNAGRKIARQKMH